MSNIIPSRSLLNLVNRWPSIWDDDMSTLPNTFGNDIDVYESPSSVTIRANVAGVASDNIDVTFEKGTLWIQAKATEEEQKDDHKYYSKAFWNYSYRVGVPGDIDHTKEPEVSLDDGILTVVFHKSEASKPKKLTVKSKK